VPIYLSKEWERLWAFLPNLSPEGNIKAALTHMAICRQVKLSPQDWKLALETYTNHLKNTDLRAFQVAMAILSETPRDEGETALPSLGDILSVMSDAHEKWPNFAEGRKEVLTLPVYVGREVKRLKA
jgi:hypothetical protein